MKATILVKNVKAGRLIIQVWRIPSDTTGKVYTVRRVGKKWSCNDLGWTKSSPRQDCKHIKRIKKSIGIPVSKNKGYANRPRDESGRFVPTGVD
ncbi:MAG TPA: hypothetical protein VGR56_02925 [Nitrososphaerales archaeon]|nr:hypothetical protein [Nitrososphaerales archaeon]